MTMVEPSEIEDGDEESTSDSDDDEVLYSTANSAPVSELLETVRWVEMDMMRGVLVIASFLKVRRRDGCPMHQQRVKPVLRMS